jgi:hypothetical protein
MGPCSENACEYFANIAHFNKDVFDNNAVCLSHILTFLDSQSIISSRKLSNFESEHIYGRILSPNISMDSEHGPNTSMDSEHDRNFDHIYRSVWQVSISSDSETDSSFSSREYLPCFLYMHVCVCVCTYVCISASMYIRG